MNGMETVNHVDLASAVAGILAGLIVLGGMTMMFTTVWTRK